MNWKKLGILFNPGDILPKGYNYSSVPIVEIIEEEKSLIRVYFTPRDENNKSEFRYVDLVFKENNIQIITLSEPLLTYGKIGTFDDSGVTVCSIINANNRKYAYYQGWNLGVNVPSITAIGVAEFKNGKLQRLGDGPIMSRTLNEPYSCASPTVLFDQGLYKMWYVAMDKWEVQDDSLKHYYDIRYAESNDGIVWDRKGVKCISYEKENEYAFGRPFVKIEEGMFKMWYCYRGNYYKIGYAESEDGISWNRKDDTINLDISKTGWDSEMIEYPCVFDFNNNRYMLYNGNGYGKTGIGLLKQI